MHPVLAPATTWYEMSWYELSRSPQSYLLPENMRSLLDYRLSNSTPRICTGCGLDGWTVAEGVHEESGSKTYNGVVTILRGAGVPEDVANVVAVGECVFDGIQKLKGPQ
uniref:GMC_OxRdtase_N domain-containing protein n=1 Tax=Steinernema glaseri TaxID=37863 RepID=A0A1I8ART6_9BILA